MGFLTGISDHGLLSGLADDDHTQYVLRNILTTDGDLFSRDAGAVTRIAAVATGQVLASAGTGTLPAWSATPTLTSLTCPTLDGGTAANDDITIQGTTHSTRTSSYVLLQPNGGSVGIGTTGPGAQLDIKSNSSFNDVMKITQALDSDLLFKFRGSGDSAEFTGYQSGGGIGFFLGAATVSYFNGGNVGIGTTEPTISGTGKLHMGADTFRLDTARTPASAGAAGNAGDICWDASFIYVCTATNAWERVAIASW